MFGDGCVRRCIQHTWRHAMRLSSMAVRLPQRGACVASRRCALTRSRSRVRMRLERVNMDLRASDRVSGRPNGAAHSERFKRVV